MSQSEVSLAAIERRGYWAQALSLTINHVPSSALDGLVATGLLPPAQRAGAEFMAWSAVHGMAVLMLDGPLRGLEDAASRKLAERLVAMVEQGLLAAGTDR